ncbi:MAG: glycosyltransferase family 4 protein [Candidatus Omnitrophica bacterium]|nr:glycosyltransferase family 4 protein [Candidatus Omnitrophota bacterium]
MQKTVKKILFLTIDFPPQGGGMARHSFDIACALKQLGEAVHIVAPLGEGDNGAGERGLDIHRLKNLKAQKIFDSYAGSALRYFSYGLGYCVNHRVKLVLVNTWSIAGVAAFLLKKSLGVPYIVFAHGLDVYGPKRSKKASWLMKLVLRNASLIIANSNFTLSLLKENISEERIAVLHPAVDAARFGQAGHCGMTRFAGKLVILTVARLVESKGHKTVIQALPEVLKQFPNAVYLVVGDGPLSAELKETAAGLGLAGKVIFEGNAGEDKLADYFSCCDIFAMVSKEIPERGEVEGFGIAYLEAAACAKPSIGAKSGGIPDAVLDGVTGILVEPDNPGELSRVLIRLLGDKGLRDKLGENAKNRAAEEFNTLRFGERLEKIINNVLDN